MKKLGVIFSFLLFAIGNAQTCKVIDSTGNNLVHLPGYKSGVYGSIPYYKKSGIGKTNLILIPGLGFDASVFDDFVKANKQNYTMYSITIPGYGNTSAPEMPKADTSFGLQYWNKGVLQGILKLIKKENITKPVIVGHFTQGTQLALRLAIDNPDLVSGVVILGGPAKFIYVDKDGPKEYPLQSSITYIDKFSVPGWFKVISKKTFDNGNYLPEVYSQDSVIGKALWKKVAGVPLPVMVRYLSEFLASDVTLELEKLKCPILVLRPTFSDKILSKPVNNYLKPQFIDAWSKVSLKNSNIEIQDINASSCFVWKDQPSEVYKSIYNFIKRPESKQTMEAQKYFMVMNSPGANWLKNVSFREQPEISKHVEYMEDLLQKGKLVMGGPFTDNTGGVELLSVATLTEAQQIVDKDPAVKSGVLVAVIKEWYVPLSTLK